MEIAISLFINAIFGVVCAVIASGKNRSAVGWFFGGFFLGVIGIIIIAVLKDPVVEEQRFRDMDQTNRRLKEQLHQERMKNETFRKYTTDRLDTHDQHLGIDTKQPEGLESKKEGPKIEYKSHFLDR